jgi:creatinine amidohydrolase
MRLELMTTTAVKGHLASSPGIVIPVGSTEQHGPDGLIGTDHLCPEVVARLMGERHSVIIAPTIAYGMSQFHLGFPGTIALRPSTLSALILDVVTSLAATGFKRIYLLNGHGGNIGPLRSGVQEFYASRSFAGEKTPAPVHCRIRSWWELPKVDALRRTLYGVSEGFHATPSEVAITMAAYPASIQPFSRPPPTPPPSGTIMIHAGDNYYDAADFKARFPDGRVISDSARATPGDGETLIAAAVDDLAADFGAFMAGN